MPSSLAPLVRALMNKVSGRVSCRGLVCSLLGVADEVSRAIKGTAVSVN